MAAISSAGIGDTSLREDVLAAVERDWKSGHESEWPWAGVAYSGMVVVYPRITPNFTLPDHASYRLSVQIEVGRAVGILLKVFLSRPYLGPTCSYLLAEFRHADVIGENGRTSILALAGYWR